MRTWAVCSLTFRTRTTHYTANKNNTMRDISVLQECVYEKTMRLIPFVTNTRVTHSTKTRSSSQLRAAAHRFIDHSIDYWHCELHRRRNRYSFSTRCASLPRSRTFGGYNWISIAALNLSKNIKHNVYKQFFMRGMDYDRLIFYFIFDFHKISSNYQLLLRDLQFLFSNNMPY